MKIAFLCFPFILPNYKTQCAEYLLSNVSSVLNTHCPQYSLYFVFPSILFHHKTHCLGYLLYILYPSILFNHKTQCPKYLLYFVFPVISPN